MAEYKIVPYTEQRLDNKTLLLNSHKKTRFSVYKKEFPFPNKSIFQWRTVKDGFKTEREAQDFLNHLNKTEPSGNPGRKENIYD